MVGFIGRLQALQNTEGILDRRLIHFHHLEAAGEGPIPVQGALQILEGGGTDAAEVAGGQRRLQQIGRVHGPAAGGTRTNQGVHLIHEEDGSGLFAQRLEHGLEALFEVSAVATPGQECAQVEGKILAALRGSGTLPS